MFLPRDVARYLDHWSYHPLSREDFGQTFLSVRLNKSRDRGNPALDGATALAALCAVPRGKPEERVRTLRVLSDWLMHPDRRMYEPKGMWLPLNNQLACTSQGLLLFEEDHRARELPRPWESYVLVARDGYVEYARKAGYPVHGKPYFAFAPMVAWVQRFVAFVADLRSRLEGAPDYFIVLNMWDTESAGLCDLGDGWLEPWHAIGGETPYQCLERRLQIARPFLVGDTPDGWREWVAERIANAFGEREARCFNHPDTKEAPGELPANRLDFR
jgi:hypothetical protein